MDRNERIRYIRAAARARGLDPAAVLAVSQSEGLSGGIGDGGHAFGPFQLNNAGGVLTGQRKGTPQQINSWAWSNQGINYALDRISSVAKGLKGANAVRNIVQRFERPADPSGEIQRSIGYLGGGGGAGPATIPGLSEMPQPNGAPSLGGLQPQPQPGGANERIKMLIGLMSQRHKDPLLTSLLSHTLMQRANNAITSSTPPAQNTPPPLPGAATRALVKVLGDEQGLNTGFLGSVEKAVRAAGGTQVRITSGYRSPQHNAAVGGVAHSNHMTGHAVDGDAYVPGRGWVPLGSLLSTSAGKYGLRSGDQPGFYNGGRDPVHVDDGFNQRG